MAGTFSSPTPWWTAPGTKPGTLENLQAQAPPKYTYDPVQMRYVRTPTSLGSDVGEALSGLEGALPKGGLTGFLGEGGDAGAGGVGDLNIPSPIPTTGYPPSGYPPQVGAVQGPDMTAANAAEFARAKDQVGLETRGALTGLAGAMAGRGIVGSGVEGRGQVGAITAGQQQLGETSRQQAINDAALKEQNALASYQGDISQRATDIGAFTTQRGQDIGATEAQTGAQLTQRGQNITQQQNAADIALRNKQLALQGLTGLGSMIGSTVKY